MLTVNRFSDIPVYEQIINAIERDIMLDKMNENDKLPSVRELATLLEVNPNTIQKAYAELNNRGVIFTVASSGAFVSKDAKAKIKAHKADLLDKIRQLASELCYAGVGEDVIIKEIKASFSSSKSATTAAIGAKEKKKAPAVKQIKPKAEAKKKVSTSKPKTANPTPPQAIEEKPAPTPTRKKMGIELL